MFQIQNWDDLRAVKRLKTQSSWTRCWNQRDITRLALITKELRAQTWEVLGFGQSLHASSAAGHVDHEEPEPGLPGGLLQRQELGFLLMA